MARSTLTSGSASVASTDSVGPLGHAGRPVLAYARLAVLAGLAGALAAGTVRWLARALVYGREPAALAPESVAAAAVVAGVAAVVVAAALEKREHPIRDFLRIAKLAFVVSLVGPIGAFLAGVPGFDATTALVVVLMHALTAVVVAAVVAYDMAVAYVEYSTPRVA